ncbi:ABC transporter ATP-binding protein [Carboxylicivirga mesophila]|uniref:ABC transporter ATP-binding protein n=1 Tax=Carboxylicivirga mesophila TaxID=1166478 RepID=A0ABS5K9Q0_9BACT|nr:ABC transporter ATP-binding protein [Carboxylicivirga mesophila]MBS2211745.1 ABC transporter ATP-binding protein [Carboxylicivirga mesophila]
MKKYNSVLKQIYLYAFFIGIINLTLPVGIQAIINSLQTGELTSTWIVLVGFVLVGMALTGILQIFQLRLVENIQQDVFARSAFEFAFRFPRIAFLQLDKVHAPELVNRFFDTLTIQKGLPKILIDFSMAIFQIFFGLILLTIYSSYFIILGFILAVIIWIIYKITGRKGLDTSLQESKYKYKIAHWLEEIARTNATFKIFNKNKLHLDKTDDIVSSYLECRQSHFRVLLQQFWLFIGFKLTVAASLLILGGILVFQEKINLGQFVAAEIIIILIINSVEKVIRVIETIYDVLTALEKIGYVSDLKLDENKGTSTINNSTGLSVKARNISLSFPGEDIKVLNNISFDIAANEKVVLYGTSGSGKTILTKLISGLFNSTEGELLIDNVPISHYKRDDYFSSIGVGLPTNQLFEGSIRDNILMGRDLPDEALDKTLRFLHLDEFLRRQSYGIDSIIDSGGRRLPRGVIQKIQIARILIHKPRLLLLEEPLQFIEEDEKIRIIDYLTSKEFNCTVLVVSDFNYWKEKCERIIDLNQIGQ